MFINALLSFCMQVLCTVVVIFAGGFAISFCNRRFYANFGSDARKVCYATGFIGTPVHELSHALFCVLFGHKITEMKLFQISDDGTLGYVAHSYNPRNLYQRLGNFFIGVAPILVISTLLFFLSKWLMPAFSSTVASVAGSLNLSDFGSFFGALGSIFLAFFAQIGTWQWWVFLLIGVFLSLHMTLSGADLKGSVSGLVVLLVGLLIVDLALAFLGGSLLSVFTGWMMMAGGYLVCFLTMALLISVIMVLVSTLIRTFIRR